MNSTPQSRRRIFSVILVLSIIVSVTIQFRTGSQNADLILLVPVIVAFSYMIYAVVKARRERRASGAPRLPRPKVPLSVRVAALALAVAGMSMLALVVTHRDEALERTRWGGLVKALEGGMVVLALLLAQWQRSFARRQLATKSQTEGRT